MQANRNTRHWLNKMVQAESGKRQFYRPIYSIHKWWARRSGSQFRSIILMIAKPTTQLFSKKTDGSINHRSGYFSDHDLGDKIILDPFMGGGTTIIEANRLGAKTIGCDLNPVAYWIVRESLKPIDLQRLETFFEKLESDVSDKIREMYTTTCTKCGNKNAEGLYNFWVRFVNCYKCEEEVFLFPHLFLNKGIQRTKPISPENPATVICYGCHVLNEWDGRDEAIKCGSCDLSFDQKFKIFDRGTYSCTNCKSKVSLIQSLRDGNKMENKLVAIEYWCPECAMRLYKASDSKDQMKMTKIKKEAKWRGDTLLFPKQRIIEGDSSARWRNHNLLHYYDIFNSRQILAFNALIEGIRNIPEMEYRNAFYTIFSNSLEYNNMMTPYNFPHRKLHHLFNYHALSLTTIPVENSVWGYGSLGAGTFVNCYRRYVNAKRYAKNPFEKIKDSDNGIKTIFAKTEKIEANFVDSFVDLKRQKKASMLLCGDSSKMDGVPDKSVDYVITDPPYYDNIHYSELSNFFYVWLSLLLNEPCFRSKNVPVEQEAIVNSKLQKTDKTYQNLLSGIFLECCRVLKDGGKFVFTFHHSNPKAWWTILMSICESGFVIDDYFPVQSEYNVNPHIRGKQAYDMDLVLVCKKRDGYEKTSNMKTVQFLDDHKRGEDLENSMLSFGKYISKQSILWHNGRVHYHDFEIVFRHILG